MSTREERRRALVLQFRAVAVERLATLSRAWALVEQDRSGPQVEELFRELHTLKGEARAVGYRTAAAWLHDLESLLEAARARGFPPHRAVNRAVVAALDGVREMIALPPEQGAEPRETPAALLDAAAALASFEPVPAAAAAPARSQAPEPSAPPEVFLRVARGKVDGLSDLCDQLLILRAESTHGLQGLRHAAALLEETVRDLVADLGPAAGGMLAGAARVLAQQVAEHEESLHRQDLCVDALDLAVREMRFVQAHTILDTYPRYVREIAQAGGKEVRLELQGEQVEADRRVLEHLKEPLLHLVRNAVDHGIEAVGDRVRVGKPPAGTVRLAVAHRGGRLTVETEDDGCGMDPLRLKERALELGMITETQARAMREREALDLIFSTRFSMRTVADETSGRGIGMDIVKRRVEQIGGRVEVESRPGRGTLIRLTAPLSVSVMRSLLLDQGSELYAVPAASVDAVLKISPSEVTQVPGGRVIRHGDSTLPVRRLWEEVRSPQSPAEVCVVLRSGQDRVALLAESVSREADLIVRPIEAPLGSLPLIAGAALLGNGRLVLLLEPAELVRGGAIGQGALQEGAPLQILLVEDSVIFQGTVASLLRSRGHRVALAGNGVEGLERAAAVLPDLIVTDIEMPRMDGLQLIRAIRSREELRHIPIITLSALSAPEVRANALAAGADHCLVKAELDEQHFLRLIRQITSVPRER